MIAFANKWDNFLNFSLKIIKYYLYIWLLLIIFRIIFLAGMHNYIAAQSTADDIVRVILLGTRMSMQTAGVFVLPFFATMFLGIFFPENIGKKLTSIIVLTELIVLSVLFTASFPFYETFHSNYNRMIFTGVHDDWQALLQTILQQYSLIPKLLFVCLIVLVLFFIWKKFLTWKINAVPHSLTGKIIILIGLFLLAKFSLFGGSWNWQTQINWENSAVTNDNFLNEAVLDSGQALYRAYCLQQRNAGNNGLSYTGDEVKAFAAYLSSKNIVSNNLDDYLVKKAQGAKIKKPQHIFLIISESYANWPLLPEYENLHIADGMKSLIAENNTAYCSSFLPNGSSTVNALMGIVTNLADANLYLTTIVDKMDKPYSTAAAPQLARLGYQTSFYYAGPSSWENIENFTKAQGFNNFYGRTALKETQNGSVWGADDKDLFKFVLTNVDEKASFNVILNVSNHSPFTVDLKANGFPEEQVKNALAPQYRDDKELLKELGHFWYADKQQSDFIKAMREKYPDSLFIVIGDHADRYNEEKAPTMYKRYGIPFIITGEGIRKDMLLSGNAGSQIDVLPTLMELIAPRGFKYYSVGKSLTENNQIGANYAFAITDGCIGKTDDDKFVPEQYDGVKAVPDAAAVIKYADAIRAVSWWKAAHGDVLP